MFATTATQPYDVIVIGAGQAGLSLGYHLARRHADFLIVDAGPAVGHVWRSRWDSLRLFTPAEYDSLPGMPFPAPPGSHPPKDDVADYLHTYARTFGLPIRLNTPVTRVHHTDDGTFTVTTPTGTLSARQIVIATGPFQRPVIPGYADELPAEIPQLHSSRYRNPSQLPTGRILVVGAANSGLQIARELARTNPVTVAIGAHPLRLPQKPFGRDLFHWLTKTGLMTMPSESALARRVRSRGDLVIGSSMRRLRTAGVDFRPRLTGFTGHTARFTDNSSTPIGAVVWATGYRSDYSLLHVPGIIQGGEVQHRNGVTTAPGLYFLGFPWQTSRGSSLLGFVGRDAQRLDEIMSTYRPAATPSSLLMP